MVSITEEESSKIQEHGVPGCTGLCFNPSMDTPIMSITNEDGEECELSEDGNEGNMECEYTWRYWEDEDDIYQEFEELDFEALLDETDTCSIASDDSFYPPDNSDVSQLSGPDSPEPISFFKACCNNNAIIVKIMIRQGVTEEEVRETDRNRRVHEKMVVTQLLDLLRRTSLFEVSIFLYCWTSVDQSILLETLQQTGLIVACYHGYVDVVIALSQCPFLDVNWQDNEGNTALITAAQAGHILISSYLLNYFPGLDIERRNCHGFTALMKAAVQGRAECVRAIMLAGGNVQARDNGRGMTPREWALFTGRYETANLMHHLISRPCAEQFCDSFSMEWPMLEELVSQAQGPKSCWRHLSLFTCCPYKFYMNNKVSPVDDGVLDHMVRVTTSISSPLIATACHTVCPSSPPCIGKRRPAVQEILRRQRIAELKQMGPERLNNYKRFFQNSRILLIPKTHDRRASLQPHLLRSVAVASTGAMRRASLLPLNMLRRSSVRPGLVVPKVRLCKAPTATYIPENVRRNKNHNQLQVPKWNYKMKRIERRQEEERKRLLPLTRRR